MIEELPGIDGADEGTRGTAVNHRMREVTELVAAGGTWDDLLGGEVRALFDSLAPEWTATRDHPTRNAPVLDALERGAVVGRTVLELGAGKNLKLMLVIQIYLRMEMIFMKVQQI